jgi:hypothetical protein
MGIPALFSEPARSAQLTKKSLLFRLPNGSEKNVYFVFFQVKQFAIVLTMIGVKTIRIKLLH